jgi:hypothetical protein
MGTTPWMIGSPSGLNNFFTGIIDDVALFNSSLTTSEIETIYQRQSAKYSGTAQSRVMDAYSSQPWSNLQSLTTLPFYKELASSQESTSSTNGYSNVEPGLNSGLVALWHLDEISGTSGGNSVRDSSGGNYHGTPSGTINFAKDKKMSNAAEFIGSSITISTSDLKFAGTASFSTSFWLKTSITSGFLNILNPRASDANGGQGWIIYVSGTVGKARLSRTVNSVEFGVSSGSTINDGKWHHIVTTFNGSTARIYVDGMLSNTQADNNSILGVGSIFYIGGSAGTGFLDEIAIWNRDISSMEVLQLYRRGANRVKYQIRSCSNNDCTDQEALDTSYKGWKGPDGTGQTYFSELYNTALNSPTGEVGTGNPSMIFSNFSGTGLSINNNRYIQYRAILESDDGNNLCNYGSGTTSCSPELKSVSVGPIHYSTNKVYVTSNSLIGSLFQTLSGFTSTLGANSCMGDRYLVSSDGNNFWYYSGSAWLLSNGTYSQTSAASEINSNIGSLVAAFGAGTLQVRTYLSSDGITPCEVSNIYIQGKKY